MQQMSITRALVELKRFDERIAQSISQASFVAVKVGRGDKTRILNTNDKEDVVKGKIQGSFDKVNSLFVNRAALKAAIVKSNAAVTVKILDKEMTVAEAIELKSQIPLMQMYAHTLSAQNTQARNLVEKANAILNDQIEKAATAAVGDKTKVDEAVFLSIANPRKDMGEHAVFDPSGIQDQLDKLTERVSVLKSEIDFVLSESNARTTISVDL